MFFQKPKGFLEENGLTIKWIDQRMKNKALVLLLLNLLSWWLLPYCQCTSHTDRNANRAYSCKCIRLLLIAICNHLPVLMKPTLDKSCHKKAAGRSPQGTLFKKRMPCIKYFFIQFKECTNLSHT